MQSPDTDPDGPRVRRLALQVEPQVGQSFRYEDSGESLVVGRATSSDLVVADRFLSRRHLRIFRDRGKVLIEDLGSSNGTRLNDVEIREPKALRAGDVVRMCDSALRILEIDGESVDEEAVRDRGLEEGIETDHAVLKSVVDVEVEQESSRHGGAEDIARYADRLRLLNDVHRALGTSIVLGDLLQLILERIIALMGPDEVTVLLVDADSELVEAAHRVVGGGESSPRISQTLLNEVVEKRVAALVQDAQRDDRFLEAGSILSSGVRSILAAPLLYDDDCLGAIVLESHAQARKFSEGDMELLVSLASAASLHLRNVALVEQKLQNEIMEKELSLAREIQIALLPTRMPEVPGYAFRGGNLPSRGVSGDYYVVTERGDGEVVLVVADVSGKGMAAALLTASLEALGAVPIAQGKEPAEICETVSSALLERTRPEKYATAFIAVIDTQSATLRYSCAGHNPALLLRKSGEVERLQRTGLPLGLLEVAPYGQEMLELGAGDTLVVYTDGITEACDPDQDEYGLDRFAEICRRHRTADLATLAAAVEEDLDRFARGEPAGDDRTMVLARRL